MTRRDFITPQRQRLQEKALELVGARSAFGVYCALLLEANHRDGIAYCSARNLAEWYGWSRNGVREDLARLHENGLIRWEKGHGRNDPGQIIVPGYSLVMGTKARRSTGTSAGTSTGTVPGQAQAADLHEHRASQGGQEVKTLSVSPSFTHSRGTSPAHEEIDDWEEQRRAQLEAFEGKYPQAIEEVQRGR